VIESDQQLITSMYCIRGSARVGTLRDIASSGERPASSPRGHAGDGGHGDDNENGDEGESWFAGGERR
jgi:UBX domain-containing protein 1